MTAKPQAPLLPGPIAFAERPYRREPGGVSPDSDIYLATPEERAQTIEAAIEAGINFFHAAYEREAASLGASLSTLQARGRVTISTTDGDVLDRCPDTVAGAAQAVSAAVIRKLELLQTDRIDLFSLFDFRRDVHTPARLAGARRALHAAQAAGQIGRIGVTCYDDFASLAQSIETGVFRPDMVLARYNYVDQRAGVRLLPACGREGIAILAAQTFAWFDGIPFVRFPNTWRYRNLTRNFYGFTAGQAHLHWILHSGKFDGVLISMQTRQQIFENLAVLRIEKAPSGLESLFASFSEAITTTREGWRDLLQDELWEYRAAAEAHLERRR